MTSTRRWLRAFALAAFVLATSAADAQAAPATTDLTARIEQIDALFARWDSTRSPGCAVAIVRDGRLLHARGYGMADLEQGSPITPRTVFSLASVSKQFTAAAILLLAEDGKLALADPARRYVPELPEYARDITIEHLLHHTSGLRDYFQLRFLAGQSDADSFSMDQLFALLARQQGLNFEPGERHGYSNTGYEVLARIVERVSGQSFAQFTAGRIFRPLGMGDTQFYDDRALIVRNRAPGHIRRPDGSLGLFRNSFALVGSGGLLSTVEDLARWDRNFYDNTLGRGGPALIEAMVGTVRLNDGSPNNYAAGLIIGNYRGLPTVRHAGRSFGYRSDMIRFPQQRFSVIVLSNLYDVDPGALATSIADLFLAEHYTEPAPAAAAAQPSTASRAAGETAIAAAKSLAAYEGRYYSVELDATYVVTAVHGALAIHPLHGTAQTFVSTGRDAFSPAGNDLVRARFTRDARGRATSFDLDHGLVKNLRFERTTLR